jgi:hypothetical protein
MLFADARNFKAIYDRCFAGDKYNEKRQSEGELSLCLINKLHATKTYWRSGVCEIEGFVTSVASVRLLSGTGLFLRTRYVSSNRI